MIADEQVKALLVGKTIKKVIVPPRGGLVNVGFSYTCSDPAAILKRNETVPSGLLFCLIA